MATARQISAFRDLQAQRLKGHQIKAYGMVPIAARFPGTCGCGHVHPAGTRLTYSYTAIKDTPCAFAHGDKIVKFRGSWWNVACVERVTQDEFRTSARFVLEDVFQRRDGTVKYSPKGWTDDAEEAARWRRNLMEDERVVERV